MDLIIQRLEKSFLLTYDLFTNLPHEAYVYRIPNLPSNTMEDQVRCIIGARESYIKAIENDKWLGFSCSLGDNAGPQDIIYALQKSYDGLQDFYNYDRNDTKKSFLYDLREHEVQHHGQLIRYIYANKLSFPLSRNTRYTV